MSDETIFDKILAKEIPAQVVYEDDDVLAFHDINPQAPVHVLVIPKKKWKSFKDLQDADPVEVGRYMGKVSRVARELDLDDSGYRVVINHGRDGQQSVSYIHAHIIGGRALRWPPG
ncbi:MAG: histidine triad nucleotide-binding protein [Oligoflexus sp.]